MAPSLRWTGLALLLALAPVAQAQEPVPPPPLQPQQASPARMALERLLIDSLADVINMGAPMFNAPKNDPNSCYRIYQGALVAVLPLLDNRPDLQKSVQEKMKKAEAQPAPAEQALTLRMALDEIRSTLYRDQPKPEAARSLWERLGGEKGVHGVVRDFVMNATLDPKVNFTRGGKFPLELPAQIRLEGQIVAFISQNTGGDLKYDGKTMAEAHKGMNITEPEFDALADDLKEALKKNNVPQKESDELIAIVASTKKDIVGK